MSRKWWRVHQQKNRECYQVAGEYIFLVLLTCVRVEEIEQERGDRHLEELAQELATVRAQHAYQVRVGLPRTGSREDVGTRTDADIPIQPTVIPFKPSTIPFIMHLH